jgi:hypothetical protein
VGVRKEIIPERNGGEKKKKRRERDEVECEGSGEERSCVTKNLEST